MSEWSFLDEFRLQPLNVSRAALYLARDLACPHLDVAAYMQQLDGLATAVSPQIDPLAPTHVQADIVADFLFRVYGLHGNQNDYFDARNSFLNEVLDRRLGIPLTLALIFIHVARRLGLEAHGVSLPGHFVALVRDAGGDLYYDAFHRGKRITAVECEELVRRTSGYSGPFRRDWLNQAEPKAILLRLLGNLRAVYVQQEVWPQALKVLNYLHALQPDEPLHLRDLGLLHYQLGAFHRAAYYLEAFIEQQPNEPEVAQIQKNVWATFDRWVRTN